MSETAHHDHGRQSIRLSSGDAVITAIPTLIGFTPADSLVIVTVAGRQVGLTLRVDLPPAGQQTRELAAQAAEVIDRHQPGADLAAVVVIVGTDTRPDLVGALTEQLAAVGVAVPQALHTPAIAAGMPWRCLCGCGHSGVLDDPAASVLALTTAVATGQVSYGSRAELAAALDSRIDPDTAHRRGEQIAALHQSAAGRRGGPGHSGSEETDAGVQGAILEFGARVLGGGLDQLDEDVIVGVGAALLTAAHRDALVGWTAENTEPGVMRAGWLWMVQQLTGEARAYAATLFALGALLEGDGAAANVALELAEQVHPGLSLTRLATDVAGCGIEPAVLRRMLCDVAR
jgi:hypothetical protein